jgi:transposase
MGCHAGPGEMAGEASPRIAGGCRMRNSLELVEVDSDRLEEVLHRAEQSLDEEDAELIRAVFESYAYVTDLVEDKSTTIRRLRQLFFGSRTEKTEAVVGPKTGTSKVTASPDAAAGTESAAGEETTDVSNAATVSKGHGRNGVEAYRGAERVDVAHPTLRAGDACPACGDGTVYEKAPGVLVRITGRPPLTATVDPLPKLRCHLCGQVFTAEAPSEAGPRKYDATAGRMIGLLKYGSGLPFNRLEGLQGDRGVPLPASTRWDIVEAVAGSLTPVFDELIRQAAQGEVLHNDETTVKILELMGERARQAVPADAGGNADVRRGLYTSGVVALHDGHRVALSFSGRRHAGENLAQVLAHRAEELPPPIPMCDALSRDLPGELQTILAHCLAHARRRFVDVYDRSPEVCRHLLESLAVVYRNDAVAREHGLTPEARLRFHQEASGPTMRALRDWLERQLGEKRTEPNSALGGAIGSMLKLWDPLTLFLRQAGAPPDNNLCERALKKAILHRKNALFYKTRNGAGVGDLFMSLIYTCQLNRANPFDYLTELPRHADRLAVSPQLWMPWNYRDAEAS